MVMAWALDQAEQAGGRYHVSVAWGPELTASPDGGPPAPLPHWIMLVSATNPADLLGPRLMALKDLGYGEPTEETVRAAVRDAAAQLGDGGRRRLAGM
jgi:Asp-tRNA(Asn)/Glu-tRNA(Gln) amidotransferase A subunit family amidase